MNEQDIKQVNWRLDSLRKTQKDITELSQKTSKKFGKRWYELRDRRSSIEALLAEDFERLGADLIYADGRGMPGETYRRKLVSLMLEIFRECKK